MASVQAGFDTPQWSKVSGLCHMWDHVQATRAEKKDQTPLTKQSENIICTFCNGKDPCDNAEDIDHVDNEKDLLLPEEACNHFIEEDLLDLSDENDEKESSVSDAASEAWVAGRYPNWKDEDEEDYDDYSCTVVNTSDRNYVEEDWDAEVLESVEDPYDIEELVDVHSEQQRGVVTEFQWAENTAFNPSLRHKPSTPLCFMCNTVEKGQFEDADQ
ncbi:uncharacterized protein LOC134612293 [Pelobates fuscus]|uniref:uncharacterized protein LOC134612293 n=1 Tax=Pelobates fuscus TaxID=191477 RepID=UPI002FE4ACCB